MTVQSKFTLTFLGRSIGILVAWCIPRSAVKQTHQHRAWHSKAGHSTVQALWAAAPLQVPTQPLFCAHLSAVLGAPCMTCWANGKGRWPTVTEGPGSEAYIDSSGQPSAGRRMMSRNRTLNHTFLHWYPIRPPGEHRCMGMRRPAATHLLSRVNSYFTMTRKGCFHLGHANLTTIEGQTDAQLGAATNLRGHNSSF